MADTIDLVQRCCTALDVHHDVLSLNPRFPDELTELRFQLRCRDQHLHETIAINLRPAS